MIQRLSLGLVCVVGLLLIVGCADSAGGEDHRSANPRVRAGAVCAMADCDQQRSAAQLIRMLDDDDEGVRFYAAAALYRRAGDRFGYEAQAEPSVRAEGIRRAIEWHKATYPDSAGELDDLAEHLDDVYGKR